MTQKTFIDISNLSFELALQELETLVRTLEEGRTTLDQTVATYERGIALKQHCDTLLKAAKLRVDQITLSPEGEVSTSPLVANSL
jgi:exodeoxyribonuclease VII small subunit